MSTGEIYLGLLSLICAIIVFVWSEPSTDRVKSLKKVYQHPIKEDSCSSRAVIGGYTVCNCNRYDNLLLKSHLPNNLQRRYYDVCCSSAQTPKVAKTAVQYNPQFEALGSYNHHNKFHKYGAFSLTVVYIV